MFIHFLLNFGSNDFNLLDFFYFSANITGVYKSIKFMRNREIIRSFIVSYFNYQWLHAQDSSKNQIYKSTNSKIRYVTIIYSTSMIGILLVKCSIPVFETTVGIPLPVKAWYPYSVENTYWFWITYLHQFILGSSVICTHIGIDTLFVGLLLKTSCQIKVLTYRLRKLTNAYVDTFENLKYVKDMEQKMIIKCIHHHERIYRFTKDLNNKFKDILIILVVFSIPNICTNVYSLSTYKGDINAEYIATYFSTTSALMQFFSACWFGNEVTLNNIDIGKAAYEADWTMFDRSTKKLLIVIMIRSSRPMEFSVAYIILLNLNSFLKICIKISASSLTIN